ncbi:MAG: DUF3696 domain-containing protein [Proteobacteria bacterium]|nr:MAG: DUF3696 domain-containing protein [Pseudomonadota bacterium]
MILSPLTVLSGPNSGGKSTFIQSILLVMQSLGSKIETRPLSLNGNYTKLGKYSDIISRPGQARTFSIDWRISTTSTRSIGISGPSSYSDRYPNQGRLPNVTGLATQLEVDTSGTSAAVAENSTKSRVKDIQVQVFVATPEGEKKLTLHVKRISSQAKVEQKHKEVLGGDGECMYLQEFSYSVTLDRTTRKNMRTDWADGDIVGCTFKHFIPEHLLLSMDSRKCIVDVFCPEPDDYNHLRYSPRRMRSLPNLKVPNQIITLLREKIGDPALAFLDIRKRDQIAESDEVTLLNYAARLSRMSVNSFRRYATESKKAGLRDFLSQSLLEDKTLPDRAIALISLDELFRGCLSALREQFTRKIYYLGPLRDEPRAYYPRLSADDPTDVGLKGEFTTAVLDAYGDQSVSYISPRGGAGIENRQIKSAPLRTAVKEWVQFLGIAGNIETLDRERLGYELRIDGLFDPTHVGVGLTQVLPILVLCLVSRHDSTIIIEQPELHLHPAVQARLADFILAIVQTGKQCLVETHSEHFLNRLRLRVAESEGTEISSLLSVYFVEKEGAASKARRVEINSFGAVQDWPKGFFDQSQMDLEKLLLAASRKKKISRREGPQS